MRAGWVLKSALGFAVVVVVSGLVVSCGGSDDSTSTAAPAGARVEGASGSPVTKSGEGSGSGVVSPRSAGFRQYSERGKLHLAEFGVEASGGEREAAGVVLESYLRARQQGDWARACGYVFASTISQVQELAAQVDPAKAKTCKGAFDLATVQSTDTHDHLTAGIASLRVKPGAGAGFALFHAADGADYWMPMKIEGRDWKVLSLAPSRFADRSR